jgi:uncharacterized protein
MNGIPQSKFIREAVGNIARKFKPVRIILFGSHAYGRPNDDSDLDLLIVKNTRLSFAERARCVSRIVGKHLLPMDLVVLTPGEIRRRLEEFDPFLEDALNRGKVLYDKNR